jgi:uncharacterized repeat protein (TIGR03803 family)
MRIVSRSMAITIAALSLAGSASAAPVETVLYSFANGGDGVPVAGLIADNSGAVYGTTINDGSSGFGTVFKLTRPVKGQTAWTETVLYRFKGGSDGFDPEPALIAGNSGALYGTTAGGGAAGLGTVFKLTPPAKGQTAWTGTVLYSFCLLPNCSDGAGPMAGLIADNHGALYGTTAGGGAAGLGTVFKLTPPAKGQTAWTGTVLYSFCSLSNCGDGASPLAGLIADNHGALYGTTTGGGTGVGNNGQGIVFKLTPPAKGQTAWTETVLYIFKGGSDGATPYAGLIADNHGALYGTTRLGGTGSDGTVFKLTPPAKGQTAWTETVLHSFTGSDGRNPFAGLIADNWAALYGTTVLGGASDYGTVFKLTLR